jgi:tetratricopeptide (TPR) repeat protein
MRAAVAGVAALLLASCAGSTGWSLGPKVEDPVGEAKALFAAEAERLQAEIEAGAVDWVRVEDGMERVVRLYEQLPEAWYDLGLARSEQGDLDGAIEAYERALQLRPDMHRACENLAALYVAKGEPGRAVRLLERIVELQPAAAGARVALGYWRLEAGQLAEAERLCREALAYEPDLEEAYCVLAGAARARGDWDRVRLLAGQGFELNADAACLHEALGDVFRAESRPAEALAAYDRALAAAPERLSARGRAAALALEIQDYPRAIEHLEPLVATQPAMAGAWVVLGRARQGTGAPEAAVEAFRAALELEPDNAEAHYGLGWVALRALSDPGLAEDHLRQALQGSDALAERAEPLLEEAVALRRYAETSDAEASEPEPALEGEGEPTPEPPAKVESAPEPKPKPGPRRRPAQPRRRAPDEGEKEEDPLDLPTDDDFE